MPIQQDVIHRAELPIDNLPHGIDLTGVILHAAVRREGAVDVWYMARPADMQHMRRSFQIVRTGQALPGWLFRNHQKTAITPDGQLVWHVMENHCPHPAVIEVPEMKDDPARAPGICDNCGVHLIGDGNGGWLPT